MAVSEPWVDCLLEEYFNQVSGGGAGRGGAGQGRAGQGGAGRGGVDSGQGRAGQGRAGQGWAEQGRDPAPLSVPQSDRQKEEGAGWAGRRERQRRALMAVSHSDRCPPHRVTGRRRRGCRWRRSWTGRR